MISISVREESFMSEKELNQCCGGSCGCEGEDNQGSCGCGGHNHDHGNECGCGEEHYETFVVDLEDEKERFAQCCEGVRNNEKEFFSKK